MSLPAMVSVMDGHRVRVRTSHSPGLRHSTLHGRLLALPLAATRKSPKGTAQTTGPTSGQVTDAVLDRIGSERSIAMGSACGDHTGSA